MQAIINGVGSYIPKVTVKNEDFLGHQFHSDYHQIITEDPQSIIRKFEKITGISERRYVSEDLNNDDIACVAAERALQASTIDREKLDYIFVAHNYGNVAHGSNRSDFMPSIATRVKQRLGIRNNNCVAFDIIFGCPGWVEGVIQAQAFIKAGMAKKCLVIGAETLSRVVDPHDRDSMIYSDGAGATIIEATDDVGGILAHETATFTYDEAYFLFFGKSFNNDHNPDVRYLKMHGRKIYEFALVNVPKAMKECLDKSGVDISQLKKILIHQANEKMDEAIVQRFYKLYDQKMPDGIMPMSIHELGNSSVATVPTLYDSLVKGKIKDQSINKGDVILFASVGSGMNVNAIVYKM